MTKAKKWLLAFWVLVGLPGAWMAAVQAMLAHRLASDPILRVAIIPGAISIYDEYVLKRTLWGLLSACLLLAPLLYIIAQRLTPAAKGALTQLQQMTASKPASAGAPRERFVVSRPILAGAGTTGVVAVVAFLLWTSSGPSSDEVAAASAACEGFYKEERLPNYDYVKANGAWTKS
ncbi:MAG: hypothetical protein H3C58_09945, partial [Fimbriimonadaceae bacterium]|nr:hypothetical protein [Fimbriimonadaceae bacterium]